MDSNGIYEVAQLHIKPEDRDAFATAAQEALGVLRSAPGCLSANVLAGIEEPDEPVFVVQWTTVAAHEDFRASVLFGDYRATIQEHFATPPSYRHFTLRTDG